MINDMIVSDYFDKGTDLSGTDFSRPNYQLWVKGNLPKNKNEKQGFKAWNGQLIHKASQDFAEVDVIKEFSFKIMFGDISVGGSIDRLVYDVDQWVVEDLKSQGLYPAKKSFQDPSGWVTQLSIYRFAMLKYGFDVSDVGVIHQYVMGFQKNKIGMEEYNEIKIDLLSEDETRELMAQKIVAYMGGEPEMDCKEYLCKDYCSYNQACPHYQNKKNNT